MTETLTPTEIVAGVMDLFPGADRQALQCLAELMEKDRREAADTIDALVQALRAIIGTLDDPTGGQHLADMRGASAIARAALAKAKGGDNG